MKRTLRVVLILVGLIVVGAFLFRESIFRAMGSYLVQASEPQASEIVVVLAGDSAGNRIKTAANLVKRGLVPKAIVSGPSGIYGSYECDLAIPFAVRAGFPESYFAHLHHEARSTAAEVLYIRDELRRLGVRRMILLTSDYHTRRAGRLMRAAFPDGEVSVVAAPDTNFSVAGWWRNREGRKTFVNEWMKTVAEWFGL